MWKINGTYNYSLHGPNGFVRKYAGVSNISHGLSIDLINPEDGKLMIVLESRVKQCWFTVQDEGFKAWKQVYSVGEIPLIEEIPLKKTGYWYDFSITGSCGEEDLIYRRYMGHLEVNEVTTTDPYMASKRNVIEEERHPEVPERYRIIDRGLLERMCLKRRSRHKDECWEFIRRKEEL